MDLQTLQEKCLACTRCPLCETRQHVVFGQGAADAEVLFVGEGPGQNEDEQGLPFVGRSGQLLDKYLFAIDLDRNKNCYIANIIKCRPPHNRDPLPDESEACMPWLREQFRILRPKIVVCLGRIAAQRMIRPGFSVTKEHGVFVEKGGVAFMGTFHPAALLRQPQNKPAAFADFVALRDKIGEVCRHTYLLATLYGRFCGIPPRFCIPCAKSEVFYYGNKVSANRRFLSRHHHTGRVQGLFPAAGAGARHAALPD